MALRKRDNFIIAGVPEPKPKKNFVLENIKKVKDMQKGIHEKTEKTFSLPNTCYKKPPVNIRGSIYQKRRKMCASLDGLGSSSIKTHVSTPITAVAALHPMKHPHGMNINTSASCKNILNINQSNKIEQKKLELTKNMNKEKDASNVSQNNEPGSENSDTDLELSAGDGAKLAMLAKIISKNNKNFVKKNTLTVYEGKPKQPKPDPTRPPPNYKRGVIPKYLEAVKKGVKKPDGKMDRGDIDPQCPPGHVRLSDDERRDHLAKIKQSYSELVTQFNMLPMKCDSLRMKQKRMEIEKELERLEAGIKIFSKDKLYVKLAG
ncbi:uncharacterized protein LOC106660849 isoform X2 [Cimex lectularius]|uniref:Enkurin domain-containing protein n=1 Tax=Cimex lectularius TaxID=79782 RepID=A0A8I6TCK0_CIMLE|nr:uncharacterized protein LOC106660849 isoform X2 [Cimex lectularius]